MTAHRDPAQGLRAALAQARRDWLALRPQARRLAAHVGERAALTLGHLAAVLTVLVGVIGWSLGHPDLGFACLLGAHLVGLGFRLLARPLLSRLAMRQLEHAPARADTLRALAWYADRAGARPLLRLSQRLHRLERVAFVAVALADLAACTMVAGVLFKGQPPTVMLPVLLLAAVPIVGGLHAYRRSRLQRDDRALDHARSALVPQ